MINDELNILEKQETEKIEKIRECYDLNNIKIIQKIIENSNFKTRAGKEFINSLQIQLEKEKNKELKIKRQKNKIASIIKIVGIISVVCSVILVIITDYDEFRVFLIVCSIINCIFVFGFSEIIQILHDIRKNTLQK